MARLHGMALVCKQAPGRTPGEIMSDCAIPTVKDCTYFVRALREVYSELVTRFAQYIRLWSGVQVVRREKRPPPCGLPLFTPLARKRRGEARLHSQCWRATNCHKLSDSVYRD